MVAQRDQSISPTIVVLGARVMPDGRPSPALERRMQVGIALYRAGVGGRLLVSGGGRGPVSEAAAMRDLALAAGIADADIVIEARSRSTLENAIETAKLLPGPVPIVLVTDGYHALRARLLFEMAGMHVLAIHSPPMSIRQWSAAGGELVKLPVSLVQALSSKIG